MSFAATSARRHLRPRFWLEIQGIEQVLVEQTLTSAVVASRSQLLVVPPEGIVVGELRLDMQQFAESGASLTVRLRDTPGRSLRALFASRTRRATYLTQSVDRAEALTAGIGDELEVADHAGLPSSGALFMGAETFTWTGKSGATTLTGVSRALYGSRAQDHLGGADDGVGVFLVPPNWVGRRVALKAIYIGEDGSALFGGSDDIATLGTFRLEEHPQFLGGDEWELRCGGLHELFANARVYVGQREAQPRADGTGFEVGGDGTILLDASEAFLFATGDARTRVKLTLDSGRTILPFLDDVPTSTSIVIGTSTGPIADDAGALDASFGARGVESIAALQHVAYLAGDPTRILLTLLLSRNGDGANDTTYDALPGRARVDFGREAWRFGAALEGDDVDVEAFEAFIGEGPSWTLLLEEQQDVGSLLLEWCRGVRAFWHVDSAGRLTATRLRDKSTAGAAATLAALDDDHLLDQSDEGLEIEQGPVPHSMKLEANWDPLSKQYLAVVDVIDHELAALFPEEAQPIHVSSKLLTVAARGAASGGSLRGTLVRANPMQSVDVLGFMRRALLSTTLCRVFTQQRFGWPAVLVGVGDVVRVTNARIPALRSGTLQTDCLVVGKQADIESGIVALRLQVLERGWRVAPAALITSWNAGSNTATLSNSDVAGSNPGDHFAVGWIVDVVDVSASPNAVSQLTIDSVAATSITFTSAPSFTPASGDIIMPTAQVGEDAATSGLAPDDFIFQVPSGGTLDVDGFEDPRWS